MFKLMAESTRCRFLLPWILPGAAFTYIGAQGVAAVGDLRSKVEAARALDVVIPRHTNHEVRQRFDDVRTVSSNL